MKKSILSLFSLFMAVMMLIGVFASCGIFQGEEQTSESGSESESQSESTSDSSQSTEGSSDSESESSTDGEESSGTTTPPDNYEMSNEENIKNANSLMNGVNAYFTDGKRTDFVLKNQNMTLTYALAAGKKQQVTSLVNTKGNAYISGTSDVFVKMTNGTTVYASNSTRAATANLYRLGYYMYEARFEEQNFIGVVPGDKALDLSLASPDKNQTRVENQDDGSIKVTVINTVDPYIKPKNVNYSAADYPYLMITLKANIKSQRGITVYIKTNSHAMAQAQSVTVSASDEYLTYMVPLYQTDWYAGQVTDLRLDFAETSQKGETYEIKEVKLVNGATEGLPHNLGLNRSYFVYSNKLHHVVQIASANTPTENIAAVGVETRIAKNTVDKVVVKDKSGTKYTFDGVDWDSAEYVGFDIKDAGIFGYILPAGEMTDKLQVIEDGDYYVIIQTRTPENGTIQPSGVWNEKEGAYDALVDDNANDFYMGQRIYTDESHDFTAFIHEATVERNPLREKNFILNKRDSSYECYYECPECHKEYDEYITHCESCYNDITPIAHPNMYFMGYDALRGIYKFRVPGEGFNPPYFQYPNKYIDLSFTITGDKYDRMIYFMPTATSGSLECAAILDGNRMMLPIPLEVGKNFSESEGERNLWNIQDITYSETIVPFVVKAEKSISYTILNLYQNWGQYPLKQVSWIQFYAPYYHLSTGVTETNCIVPYYSCKNARGLGTLPDHRAMSAPLWSGQPQHTSGGSHVWLHYTDKNGVYSASENTLDYIDSYGPIYADVYMDYISDDGNIKVSYTHMEFPQTDENRAFYEMKYEVLGDVSFKNFAKDFCFYDLGDNDSKGSYKKVGYLNADNVPTIVDSTAATGEAFAKYTLGTECPYFSFFYMPDYNQDSTSAEGYVNLSFIIYNYDIIINGQKSDARFAIINEGDRVRLSLDLEGVTLKKGDTITINAIVMPWGSQESVYDSTKTAGDQNVRDVRENTCLNPLTPTAIENAEVLESVFLPKVKTTNGQSATFNLKGGQNNAAVRVYGFNMLTVPKIEELVDGEWVEYKISSAYKPDAFGYAHYYDGYSVHYDEDGTFSYAFIVPMDYTDADGRTFRVSASEVFTAWPKKLPEIEVDTSDLPMNVLATATDVYNNAKSQCGSALSAIKLSDDGTYVTLSSNSKAQEAYFDLWRGNGGKTVTGQYFVLKYRLPTTNNRKYTYTQFYTSTNPKSPTEKNGFSVTNGFINDGEWHTLVIDFSTWNNSVFAANDAGEYKVVKVRFDVFNDYYADGNSIDIAFFGISDSIEEILAYYQVDTINLLTERSNLTSFDKQGNEIETPTDSSLNTTKEGFTLYLDPSAISDAALADDGHIGKTVLSANGEYVSLYSHSARLESYITIFSGNRLPTGQYLIVKYRAQKQAGTIEFYCSTEEDGAKSGLNFNLNDTHNYTFIADSEWHTVVIDLSEVLNDEAFKANDAGEYIAKFIRLDLFNLGAAPTEELWVDLAYIGFSDSYEDAVSHDENTWFYNGKQSINVSTGEPLTGSSSGGSSSGDLEDATSSVPGYNVYLSPSALNTTGKNTAWKDYVVLSGDGNYVSFKNANGSSIKDEMKLESYFTFYSPVSKLATGQYIVIKYRANVQDGYITLWSSTENSSPSKGNSFDLTEQNGLFIADDQWHIAVIDLSKLIASYAPSNGKYAATHLRVDFFNFGKLRDPADTQAIVDVAYIGFCDDYTEILCSDKSVAEILFYNGTLSKYNTENGELTVDPDPTPDPDPDPTPDPEPKPEFAGNYFNATSIIQASQTGGGHLGDEDLIENSSVARIYNCVDPSKSEAARIESYFYLISNGTAETGRYLAIKYRANVQVGYMQIYTSTASASASGGGNSLSLTASNGLFVADNEWKIVIIDLAEVFANYKSDDNGSYYAKHLRIDLFNLGSPRGADEELAYVDIAYVSLSNDLASLIKADTTVAKASFYDGSLKEYNTESGSEVEAPNFVINSAGLMTQTEMTGPNRVLNSTDNCVTYSHKANSSDNYVYMIFPKENVNVPKSTTGQYIMIKYRTTSNHSWRMHIGANNGGQSAQGGKDSFSISTKNGNSGGIVADGEWQYLIIDTATFLKEWGGVLPEDGTEDVYSIDYMRIGFFSENTDATVDVEYIAFAETLGQLETYGGMESYTLLNAYSGGAKNETVTVK